MVSQNQRTVSKHDIWLVNLDPTVGSEVKKTRPCIIVSPDAMNKWIKTVIIVPMTSSNKAYVSRVPVEFLGVRGQVMLDQIRTIDKQRLIKKIGELNSVEAKQVSNRLIEMFN